MRTQLIINLRLQLSWKRCGSKAIIFSVNVAIIVFSPSFCHRKLPIANPFSSIKFSSLNLLFICHLSLFANRQSTVNIVIVIDISHHHRHRHPLLAICNNSVLQSLYCWCSISRSLDRISLKIDLKVARSPHYESQIVALLESLRFKSYSSFHKFC